MNNKEQFVKISELVKTSGVKYSSVKYYSEVRILPFEQNSKFRDRLFDLKLCVKRLKEIKKLRKIKRRTIPEIIEFYNSQSNV